MAKILLVEDDHSLSAFLRESLAAKRHEVDHLSDGATALYWLENESYAVAIIDWQLPGMDGPQICRLYREKGGSTPILMLTAMSSLTNKVVGLDAGADDYISKPFEMEEFHARLRALLRRREKTSFESARLTCGSVSLESTSGAVEVAGKGIALTRREFGILELLMRNANQIVSMDRIMAQVWPSDSEAIAENVRCHITRLRQKLKRSADPESAEMIKAIYGGGYKLEFPPRE